MTDGERETGTRPRCTHSKDKDKRKGLWQPRRNKNTGLVSAYALMLMRGRRRSFLLWYVRHVSIRRRWTATKRRRCTMVWKHSTSGQKKLRQHFGPITRAETGIVAYWKQENVWFYPRPISSKASFSSLKLTTLLKIKCCKKCFFDFIC